MSTKFLVRLLLVAAVLLLSSVNLSYAQDVGTEFTVSNAVKWTLKNGSITYRGLKLRITNDVVNYVEASLSTTEPVKNPEKVEFPDYVSYDGELYWITSILIGDGLQVVNTDGRGKLPKAILPSNLEIIGERLFVGLAVDEIEGPHYVTTIGNFAFYDGCTDDLYGETKLPFWSSIETIGDYAFSGCDSLHVVKLPSIRKLGQRAFKISKNHGITELELGNYLDSIPLECFYGHTLLTSLRIPGSVEYIGRSAFENLVSLEHLELSEGLKKIDNRAFRNCNKLREIKIPSGVTIIGDSVFATYKQLNRRFELPASVTNIGKNAFSSTYSSTDTLYIYATTPPVCNTTLGLESGSVIFVPKGCGDTYRAANVWKNYQYRIIEMEAPSIIGDLSGDGKVSITDIVMIIDVIAGDITDANQVAAADVNGDGNVSITDCVAAIDLIAAQSSSPNSVKRKVHAQISETDFISASMQDNLLTVSLDNERRYTAFQMVVNMPEGMTLSRGSMDKLRGEDHLLTVRNLGGGQYLVVGFSSDNEELTGTSGRLLSLNTEGQADADIVISDIEFATTQAEACYLSNITISSVPTGVEFVASPIQQSNVIYDLQGRRVTKATKGIYIYNGKKTIIK